jgi:transcription elongation GreA/GreB family factor
VQEVDRLRSLMEIAGAVEDAPDDPTVVELGDVVSIRLDDGGEETYIVVHSAEAAVEDQRISVDSPLGRALLGRHVGDTSRSACQPGRIDARSPARRAEGGIVPATGELFRTRTIDLVDLAAGDTR